jgi:outer membrane protein assembly factor BamB
VVVYIGSLDDNIYALDATTGTKLWSHRTGGMLASSPADGVVYIGSSDKIVYAFSLKHGHEETASKRPELKILRLKVSQR